MVRSAKAIFAIKTTAAFGAALSTTKAWTFCVSFALNVNTGHESLVLSFPALSTSTFNYFFNSCIVAAVTTFAVSCANYSVANIWTSRSLTFRWFTRQLTPRLYPTSTAAAFLLHCSALIRCCRDITIICTFSERIR